MTEDCRNDAENSALYTSNNLKPQNKTI